MSGIACHGKDFGTYYSCDRKLLKGFEQRKDVIRLSFHKVALYG